jgi:hypothetical protein
MKPLLVLLFLMLNCSLFSQNADEVQVKTTITEFFEAFHKQDSVAIKSYMADTVSLQSILEGEAGNTILRDSDFSDFLKSIIAIPKEIKFEERILSNIIKIDGPMANAWTAYEFYINGKFSHCGVNSFQLIKKGETWKIYYIVDTRRTINCKQP